MAMNEAWLHSQPKCTFDTTYLRIVYSQASDNASGFILETSNKGQDRKYLYEAAFRDNDWRLRLSAADAENNNPFWNRDMTSTNIRVLKGLPKYVRKDIRLDLAAKLRRFREKVISTENELRSLALKGIAIESANDRARYFLFENKLIRIQRSIIREFVRAIEVVDNSPGSVRALIG